MRHNKNMKSIFNTRGGALMAVLVMIPVMAITGLAVHLMTAQASHLSLLASAEENAYFTVQGAMDQVLSKILQNSSLMNTIYNTPPGSYISSTFGNSGSPVAYTLYSSRYQGMRALYVTRRVHLRKDAPPNSMAIEVEARIYNDSTPQWDDPYLASKRVYQEFNGGLVKIRGCAANYDIFAGNDYLQTSLLNMTYFQKLAFYAGNRWRACGLTMPGSGWTSSNCVDTPGTEKECFSGSCASWTCKTCSIGLFGLFSIFPSNNAIDCSAMPITFEQALGYDQIRDPLNPSATAYGAITKININGNDGNPYSDSRGYPWNSLEKDIIDHISPSARSAATHSSAVAAMASDPDVYVVSDPVGGGAWYYRDANGNGLPDLDTPYFYHEGDVVSVLPFQISSFRFRNVYFYANGSIKKFQLSGGTSTINAGRVYIIASQDILTADFSKFSLVDAGGVLIAGRDITNGSLVQGNTLQSFTAIANNNIKIYAGFSMSLGTRSRLVAANDITNSIISGGNMFNIGSSSSKCGCSGISDEAFQFAIGRRLNG